MLTVSLHVASGGVKGGGGRTPLTPPSRSATVVYKNAHQLIFCVIFMAQIFHSKNFTYFCATNSMA